MSFLDIEIDYIQSYSTPTVKKRDTFASVIKVIKGESNSQKREIESLRTHSKGSEAYSFYKSQLINFIPQAQVFNSRSEANIESLTNFVYFDIDDDKIGAFNLRTFDYSKVVLSNVSCGGKGISLWILTKGITKENFLASKLFIAKELGIEDLIDKKAFDISRSVCSSLDPNAYVNNNPFIFDCTDVEPIEIIVKPLPKSLLNKIDVEFDPLDLTRFGGSSLKSDRCLYINDELVKYYKDGVPIVSKISRKINSIKRGSRAATIHTMLINHLYLNGIKWDRSFNEFHLYEEANRFNDLFCEVPLKDKEIKTIVANIANKIQNKEKLKAAADLKKVIFNPNSLLTKEEKQRITNSILHPKKNQLHKFLVDNLGTCFTKNELCNELNIKQARLYQLINELPEELLPLILNNINTRCDSKYDTILNCITNWDTNINGKLGVTNIVKLTGLNIETVKKHYYKITK